MSEPVIRTTHLHRSYRHIQAVQDLNLTVKPGTIFGLLGNNGAGKTTTIRMLLGLLSPTRGSVKVLGLDPEEDPVSLKRRVGYVPEDLSLYDWMTVEEILRFTASFYPSWDGRRVEELLQRFSLPTDRKVRHLSRGMKAKVSLTLCLAPRPELVILDDATSGLDPLVRREFMEGLIDLVQGEDGTVLLSSHYVEEVERTCDEIGILVGGHLRVSAPVEELKARFKQVRLWYDDGAKPPALPSVVRTSRDGRAFLLTVERFDDDWLARCRATQPDRTEVVDCSLEEILVEYLKEDNLRKAEPSEEVSDVA